MAIRSCATWEFRLTSPTPETAITPTSAAAVMVRSFAPMPILTRAPAIIEAAASFSEMRSPPSGMTLSIA
ncbi:hypothetical protein MKK75_34975 [Methylobacterium sp. J-030]|uniref:hypothetical protein n=1 Tax=Methylobacterium sp. J-030 TaxID=2836627 RepID=UPI001FB98C16|nr:hypothetical protein [Methylobacterium sp. J-030]MCJ2073937.1 hypothetical protein [Methylobacterium sp. J-030]